MKTIIINHAGETIFDTDNQIYNIEGVTKEEWVAIFGMPVDEIKLYDHSGDLVLDLGDL